MNSGPHQPRHRSGHRCRGARARPGPPCRRRRRRGRPAPRGLRVGGPAPGGVDRRRGPVRRHPGPGRRPGCPAGRGVLCGRVRGRGRAAHRDRQGLPRRGPRAAAPAPASTWARVRAGELPAWRARRIARATIALSPAAAGFVDDQVAGFAHRIRPSGVDRLVEEAIVRFMPEEARRRREAAADGRHAHVHTHQVSFEGTVWVEAEVDLADALDLDTALSAVPPGSPTSARPPRWTCAAPKPSARWPATSSPWTSTPHRHQHRATGPDSGPAGGAARPPVRGGDHRPRHPTGSCIWPGWRTPARFVDADQVRTWCGVPGTTVTVKPVLDLAEHLHVDQYQVPDRLADQAAERDLTCVFPWCTRPAEACDTDHVIPYTEGGPTASDNLAPLCRRHHRLKTHHSGWGYTVLEPGSLPVVLPARLPVPARPPRHHRRHPRPDIAPARPVATPPHTPRQHTRRGATGMSPCGSNARHHLLPTQPASTRVGVGGPVRAGRCRQGA